MKNILFLALALTSLFASSVSWSQNVKFTDVTVRDDLTVVDDASVGGTITAPGTSPLILGTNGADTTITFPDGATLMWDTSEQAWVAVGDVQVTGDATIGGSIIGIAQLEFASVTSMLNFDYSLVADGRRVKCNGYNTANDGLFGPDVFWDATSTETADGLSVFDPVASGAGRLIRSFRDEINVFWAGAYGNHQWNATGAITASDATLTAGSSVFTTSDVGKIVLIRGAGTAGANLVTTILSYTSGTEVELSSLAATTVSGALFLWANDDLAAFDRVAALAVEFGPSIYIPSCPGYVFSDKWVVGGPVDIRSDKNTRMRWVSSTVAEMGILFDFQDGTDALCDISLPQLFNSSVGPNWSIPGYPAGQDHSSRQGIGVHLLGGNRLNLYVHYVSGFESGVKVESSTSSTVDNVNVEIGVSDFCEKGIHIDSGGPGSLGFAEFHFVGNTMWNKFPIYFENNYGYVVASSFDITGSAIVNENGGAVVYSEGTTLRASTINVNMANAGWRTDSPSGTNFELICPFLAGDQESGNTTTGTAQAGSPTTLTLAATATEVDDAFLGLELSLTGGTGSGQTQTISGYDGGTKIATIDTTWSVTPDSSTTYSIPIKYDGMGTSTNMGYFGGQHCDISIGAYHDFIGTDAGSGSAIPQAGDTIRVRDAGRNNNIRIKYSDYETSIIEQAIPLTATRGEQYYNAPEAWQTAQSYGLYKKVEESGVAYRCLEPHTSGTFATDLAANKWVAIPDGYTGGAQFAKSVYSLASISGLAAGASTWFYMYHQLANQDGQKPFITAYKSETAVDSEIRIGAFQTTSVNREVKVRIINEGSLPFTGDIYFWIIIQ